MATQSAKSSLATSWWQSLDRPGWRIFGSAMVALSAALVIALFSAAMAQADRFILAAITAVMSLGLAGWVGVKLVPALARRTSLRWVAEQIDYRLTREGTLYLGAVAILVLACVNTGNNLLFMILACCLSGILISGVLSRAVLAGVALKFDLPEHIFAEQPVLAEMELRNEKALSPSFSLRVVSDVAKKSQKNAKKNADPKDSAEKSSQAADSPTKGILGNEQTILKQPVFFPFIPRQGAARQKIELTFPRRGVYRQDSFGLRTRFPFGFFEKTRRVGSELQIVVYPRVQPTEQFYEVLPLLSGEVVSQFRGRGHELHSLREYVTSDSARFVDWKVSAKSNRLMVREFAREDERRVMLVLDPFIGPPQKGDGEAALAEHEARFERAVGMAAAIAWHFHELDSVMQFRTNRFSTPMAPAGEIIYDALRELATIQPQTESTGGAFLDELTSEHELFKIILTARPQASIPSALWSSSYFLFLESL